MPTDPPRDDSRSGREIHLYRDSARLAWERTVHFAREQVALEVFLVIVPVLIAFEEDGKRAVTANALLYPLAAVGALFFLAFAWNSLRAPVVLVRGVETERDEARSQLAVISDNAPRLEFGEAWWKRELLRTPTATERADFVGVYVRSIGRSPAEKVWAELEYLDADGKLLFSLMGRWTRSAVAAIGEPFEAPPFTEVDIAANQKPEALDVAVRFARNPQTFGLNTRSFASSGRHPGYELPDFGFRVRIRIRGNDGLDLTGEWRCHPDQLELLRES